MPATLIEKIIAAHSDKSSVSPGDIVDLKVDTRVARDFGGANVVKNLVDANLAIDDAKRTFFTFDCNPGGSDQSYAANQQRCRLFAAQHDIRVYDIDQGIGTHLAIEEGLIWPGGTFVSTDSHANIMGAIGAFGQGMGDADIAGAFAFGKVWFKVPPTVRVVFEGKPGADATAKDLILAALAKLGSSGLLGFAAEFCGEAVEGLDLSQRITLASMATEMGGIIALIPPDEKIVEFCRKRAPAFEPHYPDRDAPCAKEVVVNIAELTPRVARPGHPDDVVGVDDIPSTRVDSVFIGSCTNGRIEDLRAAAEVLRDKTIAKDVVLKIVPATDTIWKQCLDEGLLEIFKSAGALVGNAGCGGCAAGQIGQNGPGEVTVSTGNRNFAGKQGQGLVYLASPATAAASAVAGVIVSAPRLASGQLPPRPTRPMPAAARTAAATEADAEGEASVRPVSLLGRAWVIDVADIDTDMIYHNRHLAETDPAKMGQHAFGNLEGWLDFPEKVQLGDIVITGANFGCGSSRQQAVTCFKTLGVSAIVARSFGAIYERNAINEALPVLTFDWPADAVSTGDELRLDLASGKIENLTKKTELAAPALSEVQLAIYRRGGLLRN